MQEEKRPSLIATIVQSVPGISIAVIGLSLALYSSESSRMSSFQNVEGGGAVTAAPGVVALMVLLAFALLYTKRPDFRLHRYIVVGVALAGLLTLSILLVAGVTTLSLPSQAVFLLRCLRRVCTVLILLCWAEVLIPLGARKAAVVFALAVIALGCINILSSLLKENGVYTLLALMPLLSIACLYWFEDRSRSIDFYQTTLANSLNKESLIDQTLLPRNVSLASTVLIFLLPLICYPFAFGNIHFAWVPNQDGSANSLTIQLAAATGTIIAGLILLFLITSFWGRRKLELYNLFVLPLLAFTMYLTDIFGGSLSFMYVVPLNIVQKMVLFLLWLLPYLVPTKHSPLAVWTLGLIFYQSGKSLSTLASGALSQQTYALAAMSAIMVLVIGCVLGIALDNGRKEAPHAETADSTGETVGKINESASTAQSTITTVTNSKNPLDTFAREFQLTRREQEVLQLLAEGLTANAIAEKLVVSTSTAKSHIRNIYAKTNVHTQSELLLLIHSRS